MSIWVKDNEFLPIRNGNTGKTFNQVIRREKALINLSPDIKRYCMKMEKIALNKNGLVPIYQRKFKKALKKREKKELENISFEQVHWLDYNEK